MSGVSMSKDGIMQFTAAVNALVKNEGITRVRVDMLEALANRRLLGRLKWLILGR